MYDVKRLVRGTYWVALGSALWILAALVTSFVTDRSTWSEQAIRVAIWGGSIALIAIFVVGLAVVASFEQLFLLFHRLSFANDLWILDPAHRLPAHPLPRRFLVRRHHARRPDLGSGRGAAPVRRQRESLVIAAGKPTGNSNPTCRRPTNQPFSASGSGRVVALHSEGGSGNRVRSDSNPNVSHSFPRAG